LPVTIGVGVVNGNYQVMEDEAGRARIPKFLAEFTLRQQ